MIKKSLDKEYIESADEEKMQKKIIRLFNVKESSLYDVKHEKKTYNVSV